MFTKHMSYAEIAVSLNHVVKEKRLLTAHEIDSINSSLKNPLLAMMIKLYPLMPSSQKVLQDSLARYVRRHPHQIMPTAVHSAAYGTTRDKTRAYLESQFRAKNDANLPFRLTSFIKESLKKQEIQDELRIAEKSRYDERLQAFKAGHISFCSPQKSLDAIITDFEKYAKHLETQYQTNTTYAWNVLQSLFQRIDSFHETKDKEIARLNLMLALDDARAAYDLLEHKYVSGSDYTCQKGLEERLLDHHQLIVADFHEEADLVADTVHALIDPFAILDSPDQENEGLQRHLFSPLLYQIYLRAAGCRYTEEKQKIWILQKNINIENLKEEYLKPFTSERIKEAQAIQFQQIIKQLEQSLIQQESYQNNPIVNFLKKQDALEEKTLVQQTVIFPEVEKSSDEIFEEMVSQGPFIDRSHLENVLAWHDPDASLQTMHNATIAGLESYMNEAEPSKKTMIDQYDIYVEDQFEEEGQCFFDFMNFELYRLLSRDTIKELPCTQSVLCEWLHTNFNTLSDLEKARLAVLCAKNGYAKSLSLLLGYGVDPNYVTSHDSSNLLVLASQNGCTDCVKVLLDAGANINFIPSEVTPLMAATSAGSAEIVKILIEAGVNINYQNRHGVDALLCAADKKFPDILKILVEAGADLNHQNSKGPSALILAAQRLSPEMVKILIQAGADLDRQDQYGTNALCSAIGQIQHSTKLSEDIVKILVEAGANIEQENLYGDTALIAAANQGHFGIVKILIDSGANPNKKGRLGQTALMKTMMQSDFFIAKFLILSGADWSAQDAHGENALMKTKSFHQSIYLLMIWLVKSTLDFISRPSLIEAARSGNAAMCTNLIKKGANINFCDWFGDTPLMIAIANNHSDVVRDLMVYQDQMNPYHLMRAITLIVENPQYHGMICFFLKDGPRDFIIQNKKNALSWAEKHKCHELVGALQRSASNPNRFLPQNQKSLLIQRHNRETNDVKRPRTRG